MTVAALLNDYKHLLKPGLGTVLDLACGKGQNGLVLKQDNIDVLFADIQQAHLDNLISAFGITKMQTWAADFESEQAIDTTVLSKMQLQGIIVFKYLHRPLFDAIKNAIQPGGIVIYETFTEHNRQFGKPHRDQFLLKTNELQSIFQNWEILHYFEGIKQNPNRAIAQIVCQKR